MLCDSFQRALDNLRGQQVIAVQLQQTQELGSLTSEVASPRSPLLATPGMLTAAAEADSCAALPVLEAAIAASTAWKWDTARPATVSRKSPSWSTLRACEPARQLRTRSTCAEGRYPSAEASNPLSTAKSRSHRQAMSAACVFKALSKACKTPCSAQQLRGR